MMSLSSTIPLVSIGLPVYNGAQFIRRALDSLLAQDHGHFELIISDNASTDETPTICQQYAERDSRVRFYSNQTNLGALANFKHVLELAQGSYFMWAAVDDQWLPDFVSSLMRELEAHPEAGVAMSAVDRVLVDGTPVDRIRFEGRDDPGRKSYYQVLLGLISPRYKRKFNLYIYGLFRTDPLKRAVPYFTEVPPMERLFICQFALATRWRYVNRPLYIRTHHPCPASLRYPDDKFSRMELGGHWQKEAIMVLGKMLWRSPIIPWYRKFYIPLAVLNYWRLLQRRYAIENQANISRFFKDRLPPTALECLRRVRACLLGSRSLTQDAEAQPADRASK